MELHQVGLHKKSRLAASAAADHQHVFVSRILRIFGAVAHHQPFRLGQDHVVVKDGIDIRFYIRRLAPESILSSTFFNILTFSYILIFILGKEKQ